MQRTLKRELKVPETVHGEAFDFACVCGGSLGARRVDGVRRVGNLPAFVCCRFFSAGALCRIHPMWVRNRLKRWVLGALLYSPAVLGGLQRLLYDLIFTKD